MKRKIVLLMLAVMSVSMMACGTNVTKEKKDSVTRDDIKTVTDEVPVNTSDGEGVSGEEDVLVGGFQRAESPVITDEIKEMCDIAFRGREGAQYTPVALLGEQVVAGMNYAILFKNASETDGLETYSIGYIYQDLEGNAEITKMKDSAIETNLSEEEGGWIQPDSPEVTDEAKAALDKAVEELTGVDYTPVALLSQQVVAGSNYCILCETTPVVPDGETTYSVVYLYEDLEGNAELTRVEEI